MKSVVVAVAFLVLASRAGASPIGSNEWTDEFEASGRVALLASGQPLSFQPNIAMPFDVNRPALLAGAAAAPLPAAFQEPSARAIMLIGIAIIALGSVMLRPGAR